MRTWTSRIAVLLALLGAVALGALYLRATTPSLRLAAEMIEAPENTSDEGARLKTTALLCELLAREVEVSPTEPMWVCNRHSSSERVMQGSMNHLGEASEELRELVRAQSLILVRNGAPADAKLAVWHLRGDEEAMALMTQRLERNAAACTQSECITEVLEAMKELGLDRALVNQLAVQRARLLDAAKNSAPDAGQTDIAHDRTIAKLLSANAKTLLEDPQLHATSAAMSIRAMARVAGRPLFGQTTQQIVDGHPELAVVRPITATQPDYNPNAKARRSATLATFKSGTVAWLNYPELPVAEDQSACSEHPETCPPRAAHPHTAIYLNDGHIAGVMFVTLSGDDPAMTRRVLDQEFGRFVGAASPERWWEDDSSSKRRRDVAREPFVGGVPVELTWSSRPIARRVVLGEFPVHERHLALSWLASWANHEVDAERTIQQALLDERARVTDHATVYADARARWNAQAYDTRRTGPFAPAIVLLGTTHMLPSQTSPSPRTPAPRSTSSFRSGSSPPSSSSRFGSGSYRSGK
ncbi:MAG: hypothetical protein AAGI01_14290 [Myxococcota bacterium]